MTYDVSARIYDEIYASKNYEAEAEQVHRLIEAHTRRTERRLLDVGCGTGLHDQYLCRWYALDGLDLSPSQLEIARERLPQSVTLFAADMTDFELPGRYDAVVSLFSCIAHVTNTGAMQRAVARMAAHLEPGGVLLIEPGLLPHMYRERRLHATFIDKPELKIARFTRSSRSGDLVHIEMNFLVTRPEGSEHFVQHHEVRLYSADEILEAIAFAGLNGQYDPAGISNTGRGVFIATKALDRI